MSPGPRLCKKRSPPAGTGGLREVGVIGNPFLLAKMKKVSASKLAVQDVGFIQPHYVEAGVDDEAMYPAAIIG